MKRLLTVVLIVGSLTSIPAAAFADPLSAGCTFLNGPTWDRSYTVGLADAALNAGETVTIHASVATSGSPTSIRLHADFTEVGSAAFPGTISWTVPTSAAYFLYWESIGGNVEWDVSCGVDAAPPADEDGDGVLDEADICPGTTLGDPPDHPMKNRYFADETGAFVDGPGTASGLTVADTQGCDEDQIIAAWSLGKGHERFGIPIGVLRDWISLL